MSGPLAGVRVVDFTTTFSGPYCTLQLSDLGAEVVKVEAPGGDITRGLGSSREAGLASVYAAGNRGKASIELDLKDPANRAHVESLVGAADVLVHNMRPAAAARLGIGHERARELNPRLIHLVITGYGTSGPYASRPAYDDTIQAESGLAWLQGLRGDPTYVATAIADKIAGLMSALAICAALHAREQSGEGQSIEVPMFETMAGFNLMEQWGGRAFVPPLGPTGYARMRSPNRRPYPTADGVLAVVVYHEGHWRRFLDLIGRGDLLQHEDYRTTEARNRNIDSLYELLADELEQRSTEEWLSVLEKVDIPVARVATLDDLFEDEHLRAVDFFEEIGPDGDRYLAARCATEFRGTPLRRPGQHTLPDRLGQGAERAEGSWWAQPGMVDPASR